jgi:PIN domain nuclease of toxin-antitoxin system
VRPGVNGPVTDESGPLVADTHTFAWYVSASPQLSAAARDALRCAAAADYPIFVSAASLVEMRYLLEKGTFTAEEVAVYRAALRAPDAVFEVAPLDEDVALAVDYIPREYIGDPFDRMIAATSLALAVPLVTTDRKLRSLSAVDTIW